MPHSISSEASPGADDSILPDAPAEPLSPRQDEDSSNQPVEPIAAPNGSAAMDPVLRAPNDEIKLEDLFNDEDDEDEEFPSSSATDVKVASSPPQEPMYDSVMKIKLY